MSNESQPSRPYDVFLSFCGDTRYTFTGNLYNALRHKRLNTFFMDKDDDQQQGSEENSPFLYKVIEEARISIVILTQNYASSLRCLDGLVQIVDCMNKKNLQLVWPIFYEVDPSCVRNQLGRYGQAMLQPENRFGKDSDKLRKWRSALSQVANLSGWQYGYGSSEYEYDLIQKIEQSAIQSLPRYDIFLSFSGEDTRYSFTGFLYNAFRQEGFKIFMDDDGLVGDYQISLTLIQAIEKSRLSIIIFSENFGYSTWCLDELAKIMECKETKNQMVWPIFYKVKPSDVSNQTNSYGDAMAAHEKRFGKDSEEVQKWRSALSKVADLKGWHFKTGYEHGH